MNGTFSGGYLSKGKHCVGENLYHFEWCTKYRYKMFRRSENKKLCEEILREVAGRHGIKVVELSVMPEHVHMVSDIPPVMSVSRAFNLLKGASAYELFRKEPKFRLRYPRGHLWSPGKFYRTVSDINVYTAINYVRNQAVMQASLDKFNVST